MGESYKGLTIRLGADTSSLQRALTVVNDAAKSAQNQLSRMNKAMKWDSDSVETSSERLRALSNRAEAAALKVSQLKSAYRQFDGTEIERIAQATENAGMSAAEALAQYNRMDAALEKVKSALNELAGKDIFNEGDTEAELAALKGLGTEAASLVEKYERLHSAWQSAFDSNEEAKEVEKFRDLAVEIASAEASLKGFASQLAQANGERYARELAQGFSEATDKVRALDAQADALDGELKSIEDGLRLDPSNVKLAEQKMANLEAQAKLADERIAAVSAELDAMKQSGVDAAGKSMSQLSSEAAQAKARFEGITSELTQAKGELDEAVSALNRFKASGDDSADEFERLSAKVRECEQRVSALGSEESRLGKASAVASLGVQAKTAETRLASLEAELVSLRARMTTLTGSSAISKSALLSLGMSAQTIITPMFERMGDAMVESADEIDSAYRSMRKTVQGTESEFENMLALAKEYSSTNYTSTDTMLSIEAMGGQLGIATENLNDFAVAISNIDIATDIDADTASEDLGQMANILSDLTEDKFGAFSDALVRLGNNNATLESNIINVAQRIGSMGSILGMTTPQVLAWATAVASTGQNSEAAGTAISNTMSDIETAVSKGGTSLQGFADVAGVSAEEFAAKWSSSPSEAMQMFVNGLARITDEGGSADGTLQSLGITGVRQKQALLGLAQTTDTLSNSLIMSEDAWNGVSDQWGQAGDAANEASQKSEGFSGTLQILQNNVQNAASEVGDGLIPIMEVASDAINAATTAFEGMSTEAKTVVIVAGTAAAALGPLATAVSAVQGAMDEMSERSGTLSKKWNELAEAAAREGAATLTVASVCKEATSSFKALSLKTAAATIATKAHSAATKVAAAEQVILNAAMKAAPYAGIIAVATAAAAAVAALAKAAYDAAKGEVVYTQATKESEKAVEQAQSAYDAAVAAHGKESDEALAAASALSQEKSAYEQSKQTVTEFAESVEEACDSHDELMDSINDRDTEANATAGSMLLLAQKISDVANSEGDASTKSATLSGMIDQLNTSCSGLNLTFDEQTGQLSMTTESLKDYVSAQAATTRSQAALENYNDLLSDQATLEDDLSTAEQELSTFIAEHKDQVDALEAAQSDLNAEVPIGNSLTIEEAKAYDSLKNAVSDASSKLEENSKEQEKQLKAIEASTRKSSALSEAVKECGGDTSKAAEAAAKASEKWGTYISEGEVAAQIAVEQAQAQQKLTEALEESASELQEFIDDNPAFKTAMESSGYTVSTLAQKLNDASIETSDFTSAAQSMAEKTADAFNVISQASDASIDTLIENLQANTETTRQWKDDITTLYGAAATESEKAFVDYLKNLGPEYSSVISQMIGEDGTVTESFSQFATAWAEASEEGCDASIQTMLAKSGDAKSAGETVASSGAEGASSKADEYKQAAQDNVDAMNDVLESNYDKAKALGEGNGSNFAAGVWSKEGEASQAAKAVAESAVSAFSTMSETAYQWGAHLGSNFAAGLWSKVSEAKEAGDDVAEAAGDSLHFSVPKSGIWSGSERGGWLSGTHLVENFAKGIESEIPQLSKTVAKLSNVAATSLRSGRYGANLASNAETVRTMQPTISVKVASPSQSSLTEIREDIAALNASLQAYVSAQPETAVYVDGKKLASTIAKPMNQQLGILSRRGA